jgi:hypothetical protein
MKAGEQLAKGAEEVKQAALVQKLDNLFFTIPQFLLILEFQPQKAPQLFCDFLRLSTRACSPRR